VDPNDQLPKVHPMRGFRMFVASDPDDEEVSFASQAAYVQAAKADSLDITQIRMHGSGAKRKRPEWPRTRRPTRLHERPLHLDAVEKVATRCCHPAGGKIDPSDRPTRRSEASVKGKTTLENFANSSTPTFSTTSLESCR